MLQISKNIKKKNIGKSMPDRSTPRTYVLNTKKEQRNPT